MCGICGQFAFRDNLRVDLNKLRSMTNALTHRGPDDEGYYVSGSLGFGFRRLSIIDLEGGHQPMSDQEKSVWVVFNGEIYNFQELKAELRAHGHVFRTRCDTEVIVHGYKQWGIDVLNHLNGMFGLAIWDEKKKRLMLARDRLGIKMLYYKIESGSVCFGSEIRALLACSNEKPEIDPIALNLFLRYRYTPSPLTLFQGIKKLAPGTRLIIEGGSSRLERWWNFSPVPFDPMPTPKQAEEELLELYKRAVKRQLISDVPVGLLLSGGLDSGLLLALMNQNGNAWKTYTVGYGKNFTDDELVDAARTARLLKNINVPVEIDRETFEASLPQIISFLEEPIASSSIVPMYHVCERARQDVKVALIGQGPDELFGGYRRHLGVRYGSYWRTLPQWLRETFGSLLGAITHHESVKRGLYSLAVMPRTKRYQQVFSIMPGENIDALFQDGILSTPGTGDKIVDCWHDLERLMEHTDELGGLQFLELRSTLPDELLMYADKLSMAHGLEVRVPYLDHEIVEYAERLSASFKIRNGIGKWLHRRVCKNFLPGEIIRRKKKGFAVNVVNEWFRNSIAGKMDHLILDENSLMYKYLRPQSVQQLLADHRKGYDDNHKILFSLVAFEEWMRQISSPAVYPSKTKRLREQNA